MSSENVTHFNCVLTGAGLAGLTLAVEMARRPFFRDKTILLLDREAKTRNDRTWCFWATEDEPLPPVVYRRWERCWFRSMGFESELDLAPYRYHMIRGIDFYEWADSVLRISPNIVRQTTDIQSVDLKDGLVHTSSGVFSADLIFNSAFVPTALIPDKSPLFPSPFTIQKKAPGRPGDIFLLQHFKGWLIETPTPVFDPERPVFMDFRIEQHGETRFVYLLPLSTTEALVEFTVFSPALLQAEVYDAELNAYLGNYLKIRDFSIREQEFGVIPMTNYRFPATEGKTMHIGTAAGLVKASSGYAFLRTQRRLRALVDDWEKSGAPNPGLLRSTQRFRVLDDIFLQVLADRGDLGAEIFSRLFKKLPASLVLRFLDEDATFTDILRVVSAPPTLPFLRAAWKQIFTQRRKARKELFC